jgi:hypothetical protein
MAVVDGGARANSLPCRVDWSNDPWDGDMARPGETESHEKSIL